MHTRPEFHDTVPARWRAVDDERVAATVARLDTHRVIRYESHTASDDSAEGCAGDDERDYHEGAGAIVWPIVAAACLLFGWALIA